jgi:hypothetical protein
MRIPCKQCRYEMYYPFNRCDHCGWVPEGKYAEKAYDFAKRYEKENNIDPKNPKGPGLVRPVPKKISPPDLDSVECPKCGEEIRIGSSQRPIKIACASCGAKIKILE